jgi:hypothetical protein
MFGCDLKTGGESGIRNPARIENKGSLLFSVLSYLNNRSFRRGLTHELTRREVASMSRDCDDETSGDTQ